MTENNSIAVLGSKKGVNIEKSTGTIAIDKKVFVGGLSMCSHIDYLSNHCGYRFRFL